ncbi:LysR family transcriptional regulator [Acidovorax sp. sic0104]|uniref:LysR family transcriptional regulator n=1 Tax=Acidovorax sp. sic0104 TaxID=2854784 RepID=UPI001C4699AD|nr:LysR family transcriptional regulator [Acidovorax sp. sic0104]MBV7543061.1 LysR family transcriptional regulator [Acidovorax sp. sic0104]
MAAPLIETHTAQIFVRVAHSKSISRASTELGITQSSATARMKALEKQLGTLLFTRHSRGVVLTSAGVALLPYCKQLVQVAEAAHAGVRVIERSQEELRLGCYFTLASHLMPGLLASFMSQNRGIRLAVSVASTEEVRGMLIDGQLDCAFIAGVGLDTRITAHVHIQDEFGWVFKRGLLPDVASSPLERLSSLPIYATRKGALYESSIRQLFQDAKTVPSMPIFQELGSVEILHAVLKLGQGFTFVSRHVFSDDIEHGVFDFVPATRLPRLDPFLVTKKGAHLSRAANLFIDHSMIYSKRLDHGSQGTEQGTS